MSDLSSRAGASTGVTGRARRTRLSDVIRQRELCAAVSRKQLQRLPGLPKVGRALDRHGSRPRRLEDQNHVGQVEARLHVQPDLVRSAGACARRPPGVRQQEGVIGHVRRWVRRVSARHAEVRLRGGVLAEAGRGGAVSAASRQSEEGSAARQVPEGGAARTVNTPGGWHREAGISSLCAGIMRICVCF